MVCSEAILSGFKILKPIAQLHWEILPLLIEFWLFLRHQVTSLIVM